MRAQLTYRLAWSLAICLATKFVFDLANMEQHVYDVIGCGRQSLVAQ
jgi:hypothetical protein